MFSNVPICIAPLKTGAYVLQLCKLGTVDAPSEQMTTIDFEVTWSKVKVKLLVF